LWWRSVHPAREANCASATQASVTSATTALDPKDNQQLPKGASYLVGIATTGERLGRQTGLSSGRGVACSRGTRRTHAPRIGRLPLEALRNHPSSKTPITGPEPQDPVKTDG
jgi:hypothetical protein